jgi:DNA-binding transcriptional regulator YiaG
VKCSLCGKPQTRRTRPHVERVGRYKVRDATAAVLECTGKDCGNVEMPAEELARCRRRAAALVLRRTSTAQGAVLKYARSALGFTQTQLAEELGCRKETVSRWETGALRILQAERLAIVALLEGVDQTGAPELIEIS